MYVLHMFDYARFPDPQTSVHYFRWTAKGQRRFLEVLADSGSVERACHAVSMARKSAYALRRKTKGQPFAAGWDAALILAQGWIEGQLMHYAWAGVEYVSHRHPMTGRLQWRRSDPLMGPGLGVAHLRRLDKAVAAINADTARRTAARAALADWPEFLDSIFAPQPAKQPIICYLASNSANSPLRAGVDQAKSQRATTVANTNGNPKESPHG